MLANINMGRGLESFIQCTNSFEGMEDEEGWEKINSKRLQKGCLVIVALPNHLTATFRTLHHWNAQMFAQGSRLATLHELNSHATTTKSSKYRFQVFDPTVGTRLSQVWGTLSSYIHPWGTL